MPTLIVTTRAGETREVQARSGLSIMEVIRHAGFDELPALCGGCCSCATCHIQVDAAWIARLPPMGAAERSLLDCTANRNDLSRLSCQLAVEESLDGMRLTLAVDESG